MTANSCQDLENKPAEIVKRNFDNVEFLLGIKLIYDKLLWNLTSNLLCCGILSRTISEDEANKAFVYIYFTKNNHPAPFSPAHTLHIKHITDRGRWRLMVQTGLHRLLSVLISLITPWPRWNPSTQVNIVWTNLDLDSLSIRIISGVALRRQRKESCLCAGVWCSVFSSFTLHSIHLPVRRMFQNPLPYCIRVQTALCQGGCRCFCFPSAAPV